MTNNNSPVYAFNSLMQGLNWLGKPQLIKFLLIPVLINLVVYSGLFLLGYFYMNQAIAYFIPGWLHWLSWLLWPLFFVCFALLGFFTFTLVANLIASPFYGDLAKKTLQLIIAEKQKENGEKAITDINSVEVDFKRFLLGEMRRVGHLLKWLLVLVIISIIPVVNLISPVLWMIFAAWGCALEFFGYPLENKGLPFPEQKELIASNRVGTLSFGGLVLLGFAVPVLNLCIGPAAVIAATRYVYDLDEAKEQEKQSE